MLRDNEMDWLLEPFTCTKRMKTSQTQLVLGTGLGATGTRSVAAAVDALGIPTCHRFITTADLLLNSTRHDFSAFAAASLLPPATGRRAHAVAATHQRAQVRALRSAGLLRHASCAHLAAPRLRVPPVSRGAHDARARVGVNLHAIEQTQ